DAAKRGTRMAATVKAAAMAISRASLRMSLRSCPIWAPIWRRLGGGASHLALVLCLSIMAEAVRAGEPVAVELVLALEGSASVDRNEFALEVDGLAAAFRDPEVIAAVENLKPLGAAIAVIQWGG